MGSLLKKHNEQVRMKKTLNQPPAECITKLTVGAPLMVGPVIDEKVWKLLYSAEVKICPLKTLKQHQCGDVVSSKDLDVGGKLQQPEEWKFLKKQEKKQGSNIIFGLLKL